MFGSLGVRVASVHDGDALAKVREAQAVVVGGGSTWKLLREARAGGLLPAIRERVAAGMLYVGWSAGANLACPTIKTTNDMPICDPGGLRRARADPVPDQPALSARQPAGLQGRDAGGAHRGVLRAASANVGRRAARGHRIADRGRHRAFPRHRELQDLPPRRGAARTRCRRRLRLSAASGLAVLTAMGPIRQCLLRSHSRRSGCRCTDGNWQAHGTMKGGPQAVPRRRHRPVADGRCLREQTFARQGGARPVNNIEPLLFAATSIPACRMTKAPIAAPQPARLLQVIADDAFDHPRRLHSRGHHHGCAHWSDWLLCSWRL